MKKSAGADGERLDIVILANSTRSLLAQSHADPLDVRKNERLTPSTANERVEKHSFKERQAEGVRRKHRPAPWMRGNQFERCQYQ